MKTHLKYFLTTLIFWFFCISAQAYTLSGVVYGGATPMPGVTVSLINVATGVDVGTFISDSSGRFSYTLDAGTYNLQVFPVDKVKYADSHVNGITITNIDYVQDVLLLPIVGTLSGSIRYPDGRAASDITVTVRLAGDSSGSDLTTDANGGYSIGLAAGQYAVGLTDCTTNYLSGSCWWDTSFAANIDMATSVSKDFVLPFVKISGKTKDQSGALVGNVDIAAGYLSLTSAAGGGAGLTSGSKTTSDANANYSLGLPAASGYQLVLTPPISYGGSYILSNLAFTADQVKDLTLQSDKMLTGLVSYPDGRPASGVNVSIRASGATTATEVVTDMDGRYSLGLSAGQFILGLTDCTNGFLSGGCWWDTAFIANIDMTGNITKDITLPYVKVTGTTKSANGALVGGVEIIAGNLSLTSVGAGSAGLTSGIKTLSDSVGNYWLGIPASSAHKIVLTSPSSIGGSFILINQDFSKDTVRDFVLQSNMTLSGVVRYPNAQLASGVKVEIRPSGSLNGVEITTDALGQYSIGLSAGQYSLGVTDCTANYLSGGCWWDTFYVSDFQVTGNQTKDILLPFVTITGKTVDHNAVPVGRVEIDVAYIVLKSVGGGSAGLTSGMSIISDATGHYSLGLPMSNGHTLTLSPPLGSGFKSQTLNDFSAASTHQLEIVLPFEDRSPPNIISGPTLRALTATTAVVEWQTDEPSSGWVKVGAITALTDSLATTHSVQITGLAASTAYSAEVSVADATGNGPTVRSVNFTTAATADVIAPVILEGPTVSGASATGLVVEWITSEPAKGALSYGAGSALTYSVPETAFSVVHRIELTGLQSDTKYSVRVTASDAANNGPTLSRVKTGRTKLMPDTIAPVITNGPLISDITDNSATIRWKTDEPTTGGVSWNDGVAYGVLSDDKLDTDHSARITGLTAAKTYYLTVSSKDALGNGPTLSKTADFATQAQVDATAPVITAGPTIVSITNQSAVIQWDTDEPSDSQIIYGTNAANLDKSDSRATLTKKHSLPLVGLTPSSAYTLQIRSKDDAGNTSTYSTAINFATKANPDTQLPVFDTPPAVGYSTDKKAVVQWKTDKLTDSQVTVVPVNFDEPPRIKDDGVLTDLHEISMTGLTPNKTYNATVTSTDLWGNTVTEFLGEFTTPPMPDSQVPSITSGPSVQVGDTIAIVSWSTDKLADSKTNYGPTGSALSQVTGDIAYSKQHSVVLSKLQPTTAYQVQVASTDPGGNGPTRSQLVSFTTAALGTVIEQTTTTTSTTSTSTAGTSTTSTTTSTDSGTTTTTVSSVTTTTQNTNVTTTTLNLAQGWNLIGNGHESSFDVAAVLGDTSTITTVWKWVAAKASWAFYAPALSAQQLIDYTTSKGYEVLASIQAADGFWVNTKQAHTVNLPSATPIASSSFNPVGTRPLAQGWSLIATGDSPTPATFNNKLSLTPPSPGTTPTNLVSLWAWDTVTPGWYFWAPSLVNAGTLGTYITSKGYLDFTTIANTPTGTLSPNTGAWVNRP